MRCQTASSPRARTRWRIDAARSGTRPTAAEAEAFGILGGLLAQDLEQRAHAGLTGQLGAGLEDGAHLAAHRPGAGVHQHQGGDSFGVLQGEAQRDHAAQRVAEKVAALGPRRVEQAGQIPHQRLEPVGLGIPRIGGVAVAAQVRGQGAAALAESGQDLAPVVAGAGEAVHEQERALAGSPLFVGDLDVAHPDLLHCTPRLGHGRSVPGPIVAFDSRANGVAGFARRPPPC